MNHNFTQMMLIQTNVAVILISNLLRLNNILPETTSPMVHSTNYVNEVFYKESFTDKNKRGDDGQFLSQKLQS